MLNFKNNFNYFIKDFWIVKRKTNQYSSIYIIIRRKFFYECKHTVINFIGTNPCIQTSNVKNAVVSFFRSSIAVRIFESFYSMLLCFRKKTRIRTARTFCGKKNLFSTFLRYSSTYTTYHIKELYKIVNLTKIFDLYLKHYLTKI